MYRYTKKQYRSHHSFHEETPKPTTEESTQDTISTYGQQEDTCSTVRQAWLRGPSTAERGALWRASWFLLVLVRLPTVLAIVGTLVSTLAGDLALAERGHQQSTLLQHRTGQGQSQVVSLE
jgi:hypothetical protein